ncbi:response regulator transcription factor [Alkalihalobacillus pseudalcaliphilus]|uniref:response regulator transcription factor n=1 Tax=Alkalihalobacillus pseudalcaliphilus TaxID=79884 RepID=UPI00064DD274|nr:response regulator transcription factor [Alkalihalobacillus pseudalcaliphilus]KMK75224.1 AraC family transcriptional regulator [Alkalihalobacillus pseudalcaliphilus]
MYKVLIVDDEATVREGLKAIIPWEEYGFYIGELARDGQTALKLCQNERFDLIISDIRMAGMDGLELIQQVRQFDQRIQCLIVTGFADFHYAQKAIQYQVADYLLKPIDEDALIPILKDIKNELDKENEVHQLTLRDNDFLREQVLLSLLFDKKQGNAQVNNQLSEKYQLKWKRYQVLLFGFGESELEHTHLYEIKQIFKKKVDDERNVMIFQEESYIGCLCNCEVFKGNEVIALYEKLKVVVEQTDLPYTAALGTCVGTLEKLRDSYHVALHLIKKRFFFESGTLLIRGNEVAHPLEKPFNYKFQDLIERLFLAIEMGELSTVPLTLNHIHQSIEHFYSEENLKQTYVAALSILLSKLQQAKPQKEVFLTQLSKEVASIFQFRHYEELQNFLASIFDQMISEFDFEQTDDQLKRLIILIDTKYNENLKLEKLADILNYNSAYLGKVFKNYTGEYFNTYLDKVRVKHAKRFLLEGLKVYQVAEVVGYKNVDYFHLKFKKYVGFSPSEYRRKNKYSIQEKSS